MHKISSGSYDAAYERLGKEKGHLNAHVKPLIEIGCIGLASQIAKKYLKNSRSKPIQKGIEFAGLFIMSAIVFKTYGMIALYNKDELLSLKPSLLKHFPDATNSNIDNEEEKEKEGSVKTIIENQSNISIASPPAKIEILEDKEPLNSASWSIRYADPEYKKKLAVKFLIYYYSGWIQEDIQEKKISYHENILVDFVLGAALIHIATLPFGFMGNLMKQKPFEMRFLWIFQFPILILSSFALILFFDSEYWNYLELMGVRYESQILKFEPDLKNLFMEKSSTEK